MKYIGTLLGSILLLGALNASEGKVTTVNGIINGAVCSFHQMACTQYPEQHGKKFELLGLWKKDGKFYYLPNVPQKLLKSYLGKEVQVRGEVYEDHSSIIVEEFTADHKKLFEDGYIIDPSGHRVLPGEAVEIKGKFYCPRCAKMMGH